MKRIFVLILVGIIILKVYCLTIVKKVYYEIDKFIKIENRYYAVIITKNGKNLIKHKILSKDNKIKYLQFGKNFEEILYFEFKDFNLDEKYFWTINEKETKVLNEKEQYIIDKKFIVSIPELILKIYENNKLNLKEFLNIYYVIPVKYEDKKCYKIVTKYETIIIDKETFLPKYSCKNWVNSEDDNSCKMEYFYEFEINTVTEEDMQKL